MIPFDGQFAEKTVLPLAIAAYNNTTPPSGYTVGQTAFEIVADPAHPSIQAVQAQMKTGQKPADTGMKILQGMIKQPDQHQNAVTDQAVRALVANPNPNLHFGWLCLDPDRIIVAFRGTQFVHDWFDDFDFIPAPYEPVPGRGTVHRGFQLVYMTLRGKLCTLVRQYAGTRSKLLIVGHSLGGALCALSAPDLLNDVAADLSPVVYTLAEPRVGHDDFVSFYNTHVNVCYRIVNVWDVVPHLPPDIAGYEHEGSEVSIDSGFSLDVVRNHVLATGYTPGIQRWNQEHPPQPTRHFGRMQVSALVGQTT